MLAQEIPFEIHITTSSLNSHHQTEFINFCNAQHAKPLLIELAKGEVIHQPMLSKIIYADNIDQVISQANQLSNILNQQDYSVKRLKIEIPANYYHLFDNYSSPPFHKYFEWHGKMHADRINQLTELCTKHQVHLSVNSLNPEKSIKFITLREFGAKKIFEKRIKDLMDDLKEGDWSIIKEQSEYCIYDNNCFLDNGWLTN